MNIDINAMKSRREDSTIIIRFFQNYLNSLAITQSQKQLMDDFKWNFLAEFDAEICHQENMVQLEETKHRFIA